MSPSIRPPRVPSLVEGVVSHTRWTPVTHRFRHRHHQWLVDLDDLPRLPWPLSVLARFDPADHLDGGHEEGGTRGDLDRFLASRGVALPAGARVLMLAHARSVGHVFDPLSVFWCIAPDGRLVATVLEVHNTYGGRHAYLVDVDDHGRAVVDKAFYVSPFNDVSGEYHVRLVLDEQRVAVAIRLTRDGQPILDASVSGRPRPATLRTILSTTARHALMTYRVTALIRWHGVRLWMRRLPVVPRPHRLEEAAR
ncbi:DUF1365 domain-containing protein [Intrasporangium calvum]|uniref:DUF1365 domain-containing protein n=1 Tax=Intrasporangium calvum TaxID=53358 RepID=UPI000DF5D268|nr:DUF1365 domain-containing protein [Intrasporangium calvum]AXG15076.1 DUF1365 domain-containing protein [Intrasporangium calvum]